MSVQTLAARYAPQKATGSETATDIRPNAWSALGQSVENVTTPASQLWQDVTGRKSARPKATSQAPKGKAIQDLTAIEADLRGEPLDPSQKKDAPVNYPRKVLDVAGLVMAAVQLPIELGQIAWANLTSGLSKALGPLPAATVGSLYIAPPHGHAHPPSLVPPAPMPIPLPSIGMVMFGYLKVVINGIPAARASDLGIAFTCFGIAPFFEVFTGSSKVFIGGSRAARMGDFAIECWPGSPMSFMDGVSTVLGGLGVAADAVDLAQADTAASKEAAQLALVMDAAQLAQDTLLIAMRAMMGKDPSLLGVVPVPIPGLIVTGMPNVQIAGIPTPNLMSALGMLGKLKRAARKRKAPKGGKGGEKPSHETPKDRGGCGCPRK